MWGSHSSVTKNSIFWDITLCSLVKVDRWFGGICHLLKINPSMKHLCFLSTSGWFLVQFILQTWRREAICSSETSDDFYQTTLHYTLEDTNLLISVPVWKILKPVISTSLTFRTEQVLKTAPVSVLICKEGGQPSQLCLSERANHNHWTKKKKLPGFSYLQCWIFSISSAVAVLSVYIPEPWTLWTVSCW
jgi:hypothetical protein